VIIDVFWVNVLVEDVPGRSEGGAEVFDGRPAPARHDDAEDVEPNLTAYRRVFGQPSGRQPAEPAHLGRVDRLGRDPVAEAAAGLHLAEHDRVTVEGDDVDLTLRARPVAGEDKEPGGDEGAGGDTFAVGADRVGGPVMPRR